MAWLPPKTLQRLTLQGLDLGDSGAKALKHLGPCNLTKLEIISCHNVGPSIYTIGACFRHQGGIRLEEFIMHGDFINNGNRGADMIEQDEIEKERLTYQVNNFLVSFEGLKYLNLEVGNGLKISSQALDRHKGTLKVLHLAGQIPYLFRALIAPELATQEILKQCSSLKHFACILLLIPSGDRATSELDEEMLQFIATRSSLETLEFVCDPDFFEREHPLLLCEIFQEMACSTLRYLEDRDLYLNELIFTPVWWARLSLELRDSYPCYHFTLEEQELDGHQVLHAILVPEKATCKRRRIPLTGPASLPGMAQLGQLVELVRRPTWSPFPSVFKPSAKAAHWRRWPSSTS
ncbi:hypothetical protein M011DRAFT_136738 [Sporormia fimetaria CBS 119925]|uniref:RNI-like protein n=1 Tax=Sporormia fimetaria CBS 119925 TaxID=1340428 RepID=A0A6A6V6D3_9PLEO|nr:hypothetical protein M011DRAFT_136738 [Sporormia fimetaria CBS 119925]